MYLKNGLGLVNLKLRYHPNIGHIWASNLEFKSSSLDNGYSKNETTGSLIKINQTNPKSDHELGTIPKPKIFF